MKKLVIGMFALFVLAACSGGSSASVQGTWKLVSYNQTPAVPDVDTSINFGSDGKLNANVGCNVLNGDYSVGGDTITFGAIASTKMFCQGAVGEQELGTLTVFQGSGSFVIDGNTLTITSADGNSSVVLERK